MLQKYVNRFAIQADLNAYAHFNMFADIFVFYRDQGGVIEKKPITTIIDYSSIND